MTGKTPEQRLPHEPAPGRWGPSEATERATPAQRWAAVMQDNYGTPPLTLVSGYGVGCATTGAARTSTSSAGSR